MPDPAAALLVFAGLLSAAWALLRPRRGLLARLRRERRLSERVRLEDALKHVYTCERQGQACSPDSLAGRLGIPAVTATSLLTRLADLGLVRIEAEEPRLTDQGRRSALRIVRTHRLWERYLADRTGVPAGEWHERAEEMEHTLTAEETEKLASRLGHPPWDPHGDPIPSAEGELPPRRGMSLRSAAAGTSVEIVHLEDEPPEIFDALVAEGLAPGGRLDVVEQGDRDTVVRSGGRTWRVGPMKARNVSVRPLPEGERAEGRQTRLAEVPMGRTARVTGIAAECQGPQRRRLLDLGVVRGATVTPELRSAAGDPVAYRIRGALIALRREQAEWILVEEVPGEEPGDPSVPPPAHGAA